MISILHTILAGRSKREEWNGRGKWNVSGRVVNRVLVEKPEGKRSLGRPKRRWENNKKMDLQEVGYGG